MKRFGNLFSAVVSFENLWLAFVRAIKGKKGKLAPAQFAARQEEELLTLQQCLIEKTYRPGGYKSFIIYEKKPRLISAAPFVDRVVHHALCNVIEPIFEKSFVFDSYANRKGKGVHQAVARCNEFAQKNRYVLKCDIKKYFPSIDHELLKGLIRKKIKDADVLWLVDLIIDSSNEQEFVGDYFPGDDLFTPLERRKGLPIGNQTSQFFANVYLNPLDHFIKEALRCKYYIRYVDDFVLFNDEKNHLWRMGEEIISFLQSYRVRLHPRKYHVFPVVAGIAFLGYRVFSEYRLLPEDAVCRFRKRLRYLQFAYSQHQVGLETINLSIKGWLGYALFADTYKLRQRLFSKYTFSH